ncbi:MAG TPA: kynureninase [Chloroflexota bacterium]|nr:kynureninase [Chloroflexota bacterium]
MLTLEDARKRDAADPLRGFRERFYLPGGVIYLDGNSLGLASRDAEASLMDALESWKRQGIDGWTGGTRPWFSLGEDLGALQAPLLGALPSEVVVTGSTTVNLHALVATFYRPSGHRTRILTDALDFPSDLYALRSQVALRSLDPADHLIVVPSRDGRTLSEDDIIGRITEDVALALFSSVLYRSGQLLDLPRLTAAAHERGVLIGFDCSHSAGCVPHRLHEWEVDFAFWCTYKYLNSGPGATASLFVHEHHHPPKGTTPGLAGWWGSDKQRQFDMAALFSPAASAGAWQIGTPSVLGSAPLYGALQVLGEAGIEAVRAKSLALTDVLMDLSDAWLREHGFSVGTPREPERRGGHVALEHPAAVQLCWALKSRGIVPDFRPPNVIRFAPVALYTSFEDVWRAMDILRAIVTRGEHLSFATERDVIA